MTAPVNPRPPLGTCTKCGKLISGAPRQTQNAAHLPNGTWQHVTCSGAKATAQSIRVQERINTRRARIDARASGLVL